MNIFLRQVDLSHVKGLLNASSTTGVEMDMKEFSHTNDLIENAEEWMARVREVLESGEPATLHSLEGLLAEAESIPVTMDEQQLLTVGIKARQWRLRVDNMLASGKAKLHELQELVSKVRTISLHGGALWRQHCGRHFDDPGAFSRGDVDLAV